MMRHLLVLVMAMGACGSVSDGGEPDGGDGGLAGVARLSSLEVDGFSLEPAFDPNVLEYSLALPFFRDQTSLTASAPAEHFIELNGLAATPGVAADVTTPLGPSQVTVKVVSFGATDTTYTIDIARGLDYSEYVKPSNSDASDFFGVSIASSDNFVAIGSSGEDSANPADALNNNLESAGAVYVFQRDGQTVVQDGYIKPAASDQFDNFGIKVAIDGSTLVASSAGEDSAATGINGNAIDNSALTSGAAWVFVRSAAGEWDQQAYVKANNTTTGDQFGASIAISADTIVVGAPGEDSASTNPLDNNASSAGAAYVFVRSGTTWSQQAYLKASNIGVADGFGRAVAISGDTIVVGADGEDSSATGVDGNQLNETASSAGAAYVFVRNGTTWTQEAYLKASNPDASDVFGRDIQISGETIAISAQGEDSNAPGVEGNQANNEAGSAGAIYVFVRSAGSWQQQAYIKATNPGPSDVFGFAFSLDGDALAVGARQEDSAAVGFDGNQADNTLTNSGAAYVYRRTGTEWRPVNYVKAPLAGTGDEFGFSVALSSGILFVGARLEDSDATGVGGDATNNNAASSGALYVFE